MTADSVELALQVDGYASHAMAGTWLFVASTSGRPWERQVWLNGQLYRFSYDGTVALEVIERIIGERFTGRNVAAYIPETEWADGSHKCNAPREVVQAAIRRCLGDQIRG